MRERSSKSYGLRRVEGNLNGMENHITVGSDVGSEPFPFTEEENQSMEQYQLKSIDSTPLPDK